MVRTGWEFGPTSEVQNGPAIVLSLATEDGAEVAPLKSNLERGVGKGKMRELRGSQVLIWLLRMLEDQNVMLGSELLDLRADAKRFDLQAFVAGFGGLILVFGSLRLCFGGVVWDEFMPLPYHFV